MSRNETTNHSCVRLGAPLLYLACLATLPATGCQDKAKACRDACLEVTKPCLKLEGRAKLECEAKTTPQATQCMETCGK